MWHLLLTNILCPQGPIWLCECRGKAVCSRCVFAIYGIPGYIKAPGLARVVYLGAMRFPYDYHIATPYEQKYIKNTPPRLYEIAIDLAVVECRPNQFSPIITSYLSV